MNYYKNFNGFIRFSNYWNPKKKTEDKLKLLNPFSNFLFVLSNTNENSFFRQLLIM